MPRLIDADAFFEEFAEIRDYEYASQEYEVDAVEVIRCRECEFRYEGEYRGRRVMMCDYMDPEPEDKMSDDDFCSKGRKNDGRI